jgi:hypothetical protein
MQSYTHTRVIEVFVGVHIEECVYQVLYIIQVDVYTVSRPRILTLVIHSIEIYYLYIQPLVLTEPKQCNWGQRNYAHRGKRFSAVRFLLVKRNIS